MPTTFVSADTRVASRSSRLLVTLVWFALTLIGTIVTFIVGGFPGIFFVEQRVLSHVLTSAVLVSAFGYFTVRPQAFVVPRLLPAGAAMLMAFVVSAALSPWPRFAWDATLGAAAALATYVVAVNLFAGEQLRPRLRFTVAALVVGVALFYLLDLARHWVEWYRLTGSLSLPLRPAYAGLAFGTPNIPAGLILLVGPLVLAWTLRANRWAALVAALLFAAAVYFSGSRGAWIGAATALALVVSVV